MIFAGELGSVTITPFLSTVAIFVKISDALALSPSSTKRVPSAQAGTERVPVIVGVATATPNVTFTSDCAVEYAWSSLCQG